MILVLGAFVDLGLGQGFAMADGRLKAVVEVDDEGSKEEEKDGGGLLLSLSLGKWTGNEGSSSERATSWRVLEECSKWELLVESSPHSENHGSRRGLGLESEEDLMVRDICEESGDGESFALVTAEVKRDLQHKRAKVLDYNETYQDTATQHAGIKSYTLSIEDNTGSQSSSIPFVNDMALHLIPLSSDVGIKMLSNPNDGAKNGSKSSSKNVGVLEARMDLTEDLLHLVFSFLCQKDLCKAGATCKQWQTASAHEDFWRCLNFENTEISHQNFETICHRYRKATIVNLFGVHNSDVLVMEALFYLRCLETLVLGKEQFGDNVFHSLVDCPALQSLRIVDSSLGNGMHEVTVCHDRLRNLHIIKCRVLRITVRCPQLQFLSLRRTGMAHALLTCSQLHELDISSCYKLSDAAIRSAALSCPLLELLDMSSCSCVSDETVREIALACPNLRVLDSSYCPNISLESVRLPMLTDLKLDNCDGITSASISAISHSRMLKALQLDNCGLLTSVNLDLPHLQSISLVHCRKFVDLNLRSPVLSYIKVSNCYALRHISIVSNALQKLVLPKQESLSTLSLQCYNLLEVDLSDCESLRNSICEVFSDGGGCPMLKTVILDNCELTRMSGKHLVNLLSLICLSPANSYHEMDELIWPFTEQDFSDYFFVDYDKILSLTVVGLSNSSLVSLSFVGCRGMTVLELSCPNLQKVNLDGCDHLERATFCPVGLSFLNLGICPKLAFLWIDAPVMLMLELKGCGVLSNASIYCPQLTSLDASFCRQFMDDSLTEAAASCPHIESLILSSCLSVGFDGLSSLHLLQNLTLLDLSYTFLVNLQPVFETCLHLEILKLSACKYLTDTSLDALYKGALPALCELDLSYSSIGQSAITQLLAFCTNLVSVNLNGCANMHDLVWDSSVPDSSTLEFVDNNNECGKKPRRLLETLNCTGCPNIKKVLIPSAAQCSNLSKLNLNLSASLKEVDLACFNLGSLNLSNCNTLEVLKLDCPRLTNLQLLGCSMLAEETVEAAISHCNMLEILNVHSCPKINATYVVRLRTACPSLKRIQGSM